MQSAFFPMMDEGSRSDSGNDEVRLALERAIKQAGELATRIGCDSSSKADLAIEKLRRDR